MKEFSNKIEKNKKTATLNNLLQKLQATGLDEYRKWLAVLCWFRLNGSADRQYFVPSW